jgi:hypothetical protein
MKYWQYLFLQFVFWEILRATFVQSVEKNARAGFLNFVQDPIRYGVCSRDGIPFGAASARTSDPGASIGHLRDRRMGSNQSSAV